MLPLAGLVPGLGVPIRREGDPRPVGRPSGPEVARRVVGQIRGGLRGKVEQPDVRGAPLPRGDERQGPAVRRQDPLIVERGMIGELLEPGAVGTDPIEVGLPVRLGGEDDPLPVGGKGRGVLQLPVRGQGPRIRAVGVGDEDGHHRGLIPVEQHLKLGRRGVRRGRARLRTGNGARLESGLRGRGQPDSENHRRAHRQCSGHVESSPRATACRIGGGARRHPSGGHTAPCRPVLRCPVPVVREVSGTGLSSPVTGALETDVPRISDRTVKGSDRYKVARPAGSRRSPFLRLLAPGT